MVAESRRAILDRYALGEGFYMRKLFAVLVSAFLLCRPAHSEMMTAQEYLQQPQTGPRHDATMKQFGVTSTGHGEAADIGALKQSFVSETQDILSQFAYQNTASTE